MTTLPAWAARLLRRELKFVIEGFEFEKEPAQKLLALIAPRRKNEKQKATQKKKLQGAAARRATSAEIRAAVMERIGWACELGQHSQPTITVEMHHLKAGSAKRATESLENCLRACMACHRRWHREGPANFVSVIKSWARFNGYPLPSIIKKAEASAELPGRAAR